MPAGRNLLNREVLELRDSVEIEQLGKRGPNHLWVRFYAAGEPALVLIQSAPVAGLEARKHAPMHCLDIRRVDPQRTIARFHGGAELFRIKQRLGVVSPGARFLPSTRLLGRA